eukprot:GFKZ01001827.1.p2 GENE.GFKZ01001827.1~~GFKZ01001827.1.p2  ORF type:complete len:118 (+),score=10.62 GFKZ01001827.1:548-901(+)
MKMVAMRLLLAETLQLGKKKKKKVGNAQGGQTSWRVFETSTVAAAIGAVDVDESKEKVRGVWNARVGAAKANGWLWTGGSIRNVECGRLAHLSCVSSYISEKNILGSCIRGSARGTV